MPSSDGSTHVRSRQQLFVGGRWQDPVTDSMLVCVSPADERELAKVPLAQIEDLDAAIAAAREAFDLGPWPRLPTSERAAALRRIQHEIEVRLEEMSLSFAAEVGVPLELSRSFNRGALTMWSSNADLADSYPFEQDRPVAGGTVRIVQEPVGVVGAITPWNAPIGNASIKLAPALAAGCTAVVKPAPEGAATALLLADAIEAAALPAGVVSILPAGREVGDHLVRRPSVDKVTFTGSTAAGRKIMAACSERIRRVTLELGGKSAAIVADDVDMGELLPSLVMAGLAHSGQVCVALTRILVPRKRYSDIVESIRQFMASLHIGDPLDPTTDLGPLVSERQRDAVERYIALGIEEGATLICGGRRPAGLDRGWYVEPTLFGGVDNSMRIAQEEIFGPVLCVIPFDNTDEAIEIANDSPYGLSGAVYAADEELAERIARAVRTGQICINGWASYVTEPFGGFKQSGLGREGGREGLSAFLEPKLIDGLPSRL